MTVARLTPRPAPRIAKMPTWGYGLITILAILVVWQIAAQTVLRSSGTIPAPLDILGQFGRDGIGFYLTNAAVTALEALSGYLIGVGAAIGEPSGTAVVLAALGEPSGTAVVLAALGVFFTTLVGALLGLSSVDPRSLEVVDAFGATRWTRLFRVQLFSAIPSIINALKIAAPSAVLGAILGEYVGGVDKGLGPALVSAQQGMDVGRTWALAITSAALAGAWFALMSLFAAIVNRLGWRSHLGAAPAAPPRSRTAGLKAIVGGVVSLVVIVAAWWGALVAFDVSPYVGKTPLQLWEYLVVAEEGPSRVAKLAGELLVTLQDAMIGFVAGLAIALVAAVLFQLVPALQKGFMPIAILLQSVPLVAMAPVIILVLGRGTATVAAMAGLIVFFPALVNISSALKEAPAALTDLVQVYGAGRIKEVFIVRLPACLPALFASIRIALPGAIAGALLAEWLATGKGLGYAIISSLGRGDNTQVWACVVLITAASLLLYAVAAQVERFVARRRGV